MRRYAAKVQEQLVNICRSVRPVRCHGVSALALRARRKRLHALSATVARIRARSRQSGFRVCCWFGSGRMAGLLGWRCMPPPELFAGRIDHAVLGRVNTN